MTSPIQKTRRSWGDYSKALGSAHKKASAQLETSMPLLSHLQELRKRVFIALITLVLTTLASFVFAGQLVAFFAQPLGGIQALVSIEITENMAIYMRVALLSGILLGMPVVVYQLIAFLLPGLKRRERVWLLVGVPAATLLFATGVAFAWFVLIPTAIPFLVNFLGTTTQVRPSNYFEFITQLMFWIGVFFQMPLAAFLLARLKFITARQLLNGWRYALVIIAIVAAGVTPTADPVNMGLVMAPLVVLYAISIVLAAAAGRS
ncbi:MAG: twin-arginine translocase subunit TatC [Chloroflexota bacterium]